MTGKSGPWVVLIILTVALVGTDCRAAYSSTVADPLGDGYYTDPSFVDIISASIRDDGVTTIYSVRFALGTMNAATVSVGFEIDADRNPATGISRTQPWYQPQLATTIGIDYAIIQDTFPQSGNNQIASVIPFVGGISAAVVPVTFLSDGIEFGINRAFLGAYDTHPNWFVTVQVRYLNDPTCPSYCYSVIQDVAGNFSAPVPEPKSSLLALFGGATVLLWSRASANRRRARDRVRIQT